jgi:hypothetical protein
MSLRERTLRHGEENTQITTDKELWGWYSYGLAAEVFAVCGVGESLIRVISFTEAIFILISKYQGPSFLSP